MTRVHRIPLGAAAIPTRTWRGVLALAALACSHLASGPAHAQSPVAQPVGAQGFASSVLRPGDVLRLRIWREPDLSGEFTIDERGVVTLPKLGPIRAVDEPVGALKTRIVSLYAAYVTDPVEVTPVPRVRVLGAVRTPGIYKVEPAMTLSDAIALAGGTTPDGDDGRVTLVHEGKSVSVALKPNVLLADSPLRSGDQVFVPERSWLSRNPGVFIAAVSATTTLVWALRRQY